MNSSFGLVVEVGGCVVTGGKSAATLVDWEFFTIDGKDICRISGGYGLGLWHGVQPLVAFITIGWCSS